MKLSLKIDDLILIPYGVLLGGGTVLVIADTHFGVGKDFLDLDIMIEDVWSKVKRYLNLFPQIRELIIAGDIKENIYRTEFTELQLLIRFKELLKSRDVDLQLVLGNHDTGLENVEGISTHRYLIRDEYLIIHGHQDINLKKFKVKTIIQGHEHSCIEISDGIMNHKFKCTIIGYGDNHRFVILPSISELKMGRGFRRFMSPTLKKNVKSAKGYIFQDDSWFQIPLNIE